MTGNTNVRGCDPGGNIMNHCRPNGWEFLNQLHRLVNWTGGCIAVTNSEIREIWSLVPNGTPIMIGRTLPEMHGNTGNGHIR